MSVLYGCRDCGYWASVVLPDKSRSCLSCLYRRRTGKTPLSQSQHIAQSHRRKEEQEESGNSAVNCSLEERPFPHWFYGSERWAPSDVSLQKFPWDRGF